jgi:hypothetical protein
MGKTGAKSSERKMEYVEITQAEEMPVLSAAEKAELIQSLKDAEAEIENGDCLKFAPGEFGDWIKQQFDEAIARNHGSKAADV